MPPPVTQSFATASTVAKRKLAADAIESSHERMVGQLIVPVGGMSTSISQYMQDSLAECVEHRLHDPLLFLFHHMRHLKLVLTSEVLSGAPPMNSQRSHLGAETIGSSSFQFFDRLHRYVFQHEGARALKTCFFVFQRGSGTLATSTKLALRSAVFSCFTELFAVSHRLDHSSMMSGSSITLPATELSKIPFRIALAFYFAVLEEQLMFLATPQVLLHRMLAVIEKGLNSSLGLLGQSLLSRYQSVMTASFEWARKASQERATWMLKSIVKVLEDTLRCGPMTIVTATTRKKKQDTVPTVPAAVLAFSGLQNPPQSSSDPLSPYLLVGDEQARDVLVAALDDLCASGTSGASPTKLSASSRASAAWVTSRANIDLATFEDHLMFMKLGVQVLRQVALPLFTIVESRCRVVPLASHIPGILRVDFVDVFCKLRESRAVVTICNKAVDLIAAASKSNVEHTAKSIADALVISFDTLCDCGPALSLSQFIVIVDMSVTRLV
jgi:hypothetical protein